MTIRRILLLLLRSPMLQMMLKIFCNKLVQNILCLPPRWIALVRLILHANPATWSHHGRTKLSDIFLIPYNRFRWRGRQRQTELSIWHLPYPCNRVYHHGCTEQPFSSKCAVSDYKAQQSFGFSQIRNKIPTTQQKFWASSDLILCLLSPSDQQHHHYCQSSHYHDNHHQGHELLGSLYINL